MSLKAYLKEIGERPSSEVALYTPFAIHVLRGVLGYPADHCLINKADEEGVPDVRLLSGEDRSQWVFCEGKIEDADLRVEKRREALWKEQAAKYVRPESAYVLLFAPRSFYLLSVSGALLAAAHLEEDAVVDARSGERLPLADKSLEKLLASVTFEESLRRPHYELFRQGKAPCGHIKLGEETLPLLAETFDWAVRELKLYCGGTFDRLREQHRKAAAEIAEIDRTIESGLYGGEEGLKKLRWKKWRLRRKNGVAFRLFDDRDGDYPMFCHDQAFAGTEKEADLRDVFLTNTVHVALSRLIFVRICEDAGLVKHKVSNGGLAAWSQFMDDVGTAYQDLIEAAYRSVRHVYCATFEESVFDWFGKLNEELHLLLERALFRLNAFSFAGLDRDVLGDIYQSFRPRAERKRLGEHNTPVEVADYILARIGYASDPEVMNKRLLDPSCGSFTFGSRALLPLLAAAGRSGLSPANQLELARKNVQGWDINSFSTFLAHLSLLFSTMDLYLAAKKKDRKFGLGEGFDVKWRDSLQNRDPEEFDYVVGNPPFVRNERVPEEEREAYAAAFGKDPDINVAYKNTDLSTYFLVLAAKRWARKPGGAIGMVAPIGQANIKAAQNLRGRLAEETIFEVVSLEWMAKEVFPDADIIPMLLFLRRGKAAKGHKVAVVSGLRSKAELARAAADEKFRKEHTALIDYQAWLKLSPTGDWPLEVKAEDVPVLEKLNKLPRLSEAAAFTFAVKLGSGAKITRAVDDKGRKGGEAPFLKGQHVAVFGLSEPDELIDVSRIGEAADPSVWRNLDFYRENRKNSDDTGLGRKDLGNIEVAGIKPGDNRCCLITKIYVTLNAAVCDPLAICCNDTAIVGVPGSLSVYSLAAIINSTISRYYAFLLGRTGILLRRRATWQPRTLNTLPLPRLTKSSAKKLHDLSVEAHSLSDGAERTEMDVYLAAMKDCGKPTKAGFLRVTVSGAKPVDAEELAAAEPDGARLAGDGWEVSAPDKSTLMLVRLAALASEKDELDAEEFQNLPMPEEAAERERIGREVAGVARDLARSQKRMAEIQVEIDEVVAAGLGLSGAELKIVLARCAEFPLNVTVGRPRYVWSADRKRQARRVYEAGKRFK